MIQANELRIGNRIRRKSNASICIVNWGIIRDFQLLDASISDYEEIPISSELLQQHGFEAMLDAPIFFYDDFKLFFVDGVFRFNYGNYTKMEVLYFHQLQNIFYFLRGEELTYNRKADIFKKKMKL